MREPSPQDRAELATEQEDVRKNIESIIQTLNTDLVRACTLGMVVHLKENFIEEAGDPVPLHVLSVVRITAWVGFRRES
ncbi:MAG: hypothetical protein V3W44_09880 [Dehalococcoidales bacterium]